MNVVKSLINGVEVSLETGRLAKQADGAVLVRHGDTVVLVTVVADRTLSEKDFQPISLAGINPTPKR